MRVTEAAILLRVKGLHFWLKCCQKITNIVTFHKIFIGITIIFYINKCIKGLQSGNEAIIIL